MPKSRFGRLIPAMITPFDSDLKLDLDTAQKLAVRLIEGGSDSLIISGTTGESPTVFYPAEDRAVPAVVRGRETAASRSSRTSATTARPTRSTSRRGARSSASTASCAWCRTTTSLRRRACTALQDHRGCGRTADHPVQHPRPLRRQHGGRDHAAPGPRVRQRRGRQGGLGQARPGEGHRRGRAGGFRCVLRRRRGHARHHGASAAWASSPPSATSRRSA